MFVNNRTSINGLSERQRQVNVKPAGQLVALSHRRESDMHKSELCKRSPSTLQCTKLEQLALELAGTCLRPVVANGRYFTHLCILTRFERGLAVHYHAALWLETKPKPGVDVPL